MLDAIKLVKRDHCRDLVGIDTICCCPFSNNVHQADFLMLLFFDVCLAEKFTIGLWNPNRESFGKCFWELQIIRWRFSYGVSRPVWSNARVCSTSSSTCCPSLHSSSWYPFSRCTDYVQKLFAGKLNLSLMVTYAISLSRLAIIYDIEKMRFQILYVQLLYQSQSIWDSHVIFCLRTLY